MDLSTLAETATTAYLAGVASHAADQTDAATLSIYRRVRDYLSRRGHGQDFTSRDERDVKYEILAALADDPQFANELRNLIEAEPAARFEGAGSVYGNVTLKGKYVAGRDITFGKENEER
ncbi:hypothetical protein ACFVZ3_15445 [Kitasatospora purpeofusca]|uniref:hypothetical protein n=1 Tax=Kitasatospora purpeofusca TaxID=67352 RepID=UPI00369BD85E